MKTQELTLKQISVLHNMVRYKCFIVERPKEKKIVIGTPPQASKVYIRTLRSLERRGLVELIRNDYEPGSNGVIIIQRSWAVTEKGKDVYHQQKRGYVNWSRICRM